MKSEKTTKSGLSSQKALDLIEGIMEDPFSGIGKPEPLKYLDANTWSRRITQEHRLIYRITDDRIYFLFSPSSLPLRD